MIETFKNFTFEAAHQLPPHSGLHGHTFHIGIVFRGERHPLYGWCENLDAADEHIQKVFRQLDHKFLNDIEGLENPSLENLAEWIWNRMVEMFPKTLDRVTVSRGPNGMEEGCTYTGRPAIAA